MGIIKKLYGIFGITNKKHPAVSLKKKKSRGTLKTTANVSADVKHTPQPVPENYREKQKNYSCIVTVNNEDVAIEISNAIDRKLRIGSEVGIKDGDIEVFIKPIYDINKAKKIALDVLQKEVYRDNKIKWTIYDHIRYEKRKYRRLNLVNIDKQSIFSMLNENAGQKEKSKITLHKSVFTVYNRNTAQYFGELVDISQGGFKLISYVPIEMNAEFYLEIDFRTIKKIEQKIIFNAECLSINNTLGSDFYICNFQFTRIDLKELKIIKQFIDLFSKLD